MLEQRAELQARANRDGVNARVAVHTAAKADMAKVIRNPIPPRAIFVTSYRYISVSRRDTVTLHGCTPVQSIHLQNAVLSRPSAQAQLRCCASPSGGALDAASGVLPDERFLGLAHPRIDGVLLLVALQVVIPHVPTEARCDDHGRQDGERGQEGANDAPVAAKGDTIQAHVRPSFLRLHTLVVPRHASWPGATCLTRRALARS